MNLKVEIKKHVLNFNFDAKTSRDTLKTKETWYVFISLNGICGIGECSPIRGLSIDDVDEIPNVLEVIKNKGINELEVLMKLIYSPYLDNFPCVRFGFETALLDLKNGGNRIVFDTPFSHFKEKIEINGLVWMGNEDFMKQQIHEKLNKGFKCLKLKIGGIDFDSEIKLLEAIRSEFLPSQLEIRLDANGSFSTQNALARINVLSKFNIHSIEQPIKAGNLTKMKEICIHSSIPIALDEELIGVNTKEEKENIIRLIKPTYIILKPSLVGGIKSCNEWIEIAEKYSVKWWLTSALESNVGLNAIAQYASSLKVSIPQGLGTGQIYSNNIDSPLTVESGKIFYSKNKKWNNDFFNII